ncbi:MAG: ribosome small subunit-dependent GTPase A [Alkalibacterium sp.]|nr:ribosome small subunit-dependent GTPase A [Alkalibacterium sp.]
MLEQYGWNTALQNEWDVLKKENWVNGRIMTQSRDLSKVRMEQGEWLCSLPGSFNYNPSFEFPAVGDWVAVEQLLGEKRGIIRHVLNRQSLFVRNTAGLETKAQVIAANIDYAFLVMSCNDDFNLRRLERYLIATWDSGAQPVIVLTKSDLITDAKRLELELEIDQIAFGVPLYFVSNETGENIEALSHILQPNLTAALLGSSGVGKSTLVNSLLKDEKMKVNTIREDDSKGKHTTTHRELILLPEGGIIVDTPGMREFQLWNEGDSTGLSESFSDIESLISACKFNDCRHDTEPGCAIKQALSDGTLAQDRYNSYLKLQKELAYVERKENEKMMRQEKEKWKAISKTVKKMYKNN